MKNTKTCTQCRRRKQEEDFYSCKGYLRSECKKCTIKRNVSYQRKAQSWKNRFVDNDTQRSYMGEYYSKNKEKFAEYRRNFKERNPDYYRDYARNRKNQHKQNNSDKPRS